MMPFEFYLDFFLLGFSGSLHCVTMCGGIVLSLAKSQKARLYHLVYQLGRGLAYTFFGAFLGGIGSKVLSLISLDAQKIILGVVGLVLVLMGLGWLGVREDSSSISSWSRFFSRWSAWLLKRGGRSALMIGMASALLPCGLLYGALLKVGFTGSWQSGALAMYVFWLGTVPALLITGLMGNYLQSQAHRWSSLGGLTLALSGCYMIYLAFTVTEGLHCH